MNRERERGKQRKRERGIYIQVYTCTERIYTHARTQQQQPDSARDKKVRKKREQRRKEVKNGRDLRQRETRH